MGKTCHATTQYSWTFEYFCPSILNFGKIANPLYELLKGQTEKGRKKETSYHGSQSMKMHLMIC